MERGTQEELINYSGFYSELWKRQSTGSAWGVEPGDG